jgi:hypothetical protein
MTTTHTTTNNLMFLLAAAPLGMGCIIVTDDGDDTVAETGNQTSNGDTTPADTGTGTDTTPVTSSGSGSGSEGPGDSTQGEESSTASVDSTSGGGEVGNCVDYAAAAVECGLPYSEYAESYCNYTLEYQLEYSAECGMAYEEYLACLTALSCEELMSASPCTTQLDALLELGCPAVE